MTEHSSEQSAHRPEEGLRLVKPPEQAEHSSTEFTVSPEELEEMLDPKNIEGEMLRVQKNVNRVINSKNDWPHRLNEIISRLLARGEKVYLPLDKETEKSFVVQRTAQMEKEKQKAVLADMSPSKKYEDVDQEQFQKNLTYVLAVENRKTDWLETRVYPTLFERAKLQALGDVQSFMVREVNNPSAKLDYFTDLQDVSVRFVDDIQFLLEGHSSLQASGDYSHGMKEIRVVVPPYVDVSDEFVVYQTLVHEYVHAISHRKYGTELALTRKDKLSDAERTVGLNEAMTEVIAYLISNEHLDKQKMPMESRTKRKPSRYDSGYADYIARLEVITKKIPKRFFIDALLAKEGEDALRKKFDGTFDGEITLESFIKFVEDGKTLRNKKGK